MAAGLAALGNTTRLRLLRCLVQQGRGGLTIGEIQRRLGVPASTLAHHLRTLAAAGVITQSRAGREVRCRADFAAIRAIGDFLMERCCAGETACDA